MTVKDELKKFQENIVDMVQLGSKEVARGVVQAKKQVVRYQFVQRRKELLAELGRYLYDAHRDGLPDAVAKFFEETEFKEIFSEIENLDKELENALDK